MTILHLYYIICETKIYQPNNFRGDIMQPNKLITDDEFESSGNEQNGKEGGTEKSIITAVFIIALLGIIGVTAIWTDLNDKNRGAADEKMTQSIKSAKVITSDYCHGDQVHYLHQEGATYSTVVVIGGRAYAITDKALPPTKEQIHPPYDGVLNGTIHDIRNEIPKWETARAMMSKCEE